MSTCPEFTFSAMAIIGDTSRHVGVGVGFMLIDVLVRLLVVLDLAEEETQHGLLQKGHLHAARVGLEARKFRVVHRPPDSEHVRCK